MTTYDIELHLEEGELPEREIKYVEYENRDEYDFEWGEEVALVKFEEDMEYDNAIYQKENEVVRDMRNDYIMATLVIVPKEIEESYREAYFS